VNSTSKYNSSVLKEGQGALASVRFKPIEEFIQC